MKPTKLSPREIEIVKLITQEQTSIDIASTLKISIRTVDTHRKNILRKTGIKNLVGLTKFAIEKGWLNNFYYKKSSQ